MAVEYGVNLASEGRDYPHYWELCVGSCHAATLLRADVQAQIRRAHREIGFKYIRFHGLLDDDMSVVIKPMMPFAAPRLSFFNIDPIFDFLLDEALCRARIYAGGLCIDRADDLPLQGLLFDAEKG